MNRLIVFAKLLKLTPSNLLAKGLILMGILMLAATPTNLIPALGLWATSAALSLFSQIKDSITETNELMAQSISKQETMIAALVKRNATSKNPNGLTEHPQEEKSDFPSHS